MSVRIEIEDAPDQATQDAVSDGLSRYNVAQVGPDPSSPPVWIVARDAEGAVIGGLQGVVLWTWFFVVCLWVDDAARGAGLGSTLLRTAERAAADRGCRNAYLNTFSFQAPDFYRRQGYEVFGKLEGFPGDNSQFWMRKRLADG
ncbi:GNAT family N-acetyltransferase [Hansschlegelia quercus]|uniref:GNAT family N-acetyltransferase n=1 Tax=Hansschlegelia quercus TaxID=2528245 RepID=A0A4Q9GKM8_9HYPH|nr:GNAT family N-acetyltransferase [Hansschlegelia quercus]TBN54853.1 GNAT family N-acetyltransferase [Hansschlegelia quercus]